MTYIIPSFKYNEHGILVPEISSRKIEGEVPERNDTEPTKKVDSENSKTTRKRRKKYKLKR